MTVSLRPHPCGVVDLHLCQQFSVYAEVAKAASLIVDDAVALTGHWDEAGPLTQLRALQGSEEVPGDSVDQARALWWARPKQEFRKQSLWENTGMIFTFSLFTDINLFCKY